MFHTDLFKSPSLDFFYQINFVGHQKPSSVDYSMATNNIKEKRATKSINIHLIIAELVSIFSLFYNILYNQKL